MALFGALYTGVSGLQSSQESLNVVAHNITNADTTGYVRQQVSYSTREYNQISNDTTGVAKKQVGLGVYISEVRQVRDQFVDASYREESGRSEFYNVNYEAIEQVEGILGEMDDAIFNDALGDLWSAIEELVKDPSSEVCQNMLVQYANGFVEAAKNVYTDLSDYQMELNYTIKTDIDQINKIGNQIYELNKQIRAIETGGVENANDLRDNRNELLDELGELANISYQTDAFGNVLVKVEGHDFVCMDQVNEMGYQTDPETGFYKVFWPDSAKSVVNEAGQREYLPDSAPVFDFSIEIAATYDTDIGKLKGEVLARGDHAGRYTDTEDEESYSKVSDSVMMNVMAEFDTLVHNVVTAVNDVLKNSADPTTGYLCDSNGNPIQMFERIGCDEYDENGNPTAEDPNNTSTMFTCSNLMINEDLMQYPTHLGFVKADDSVDYETAKALEAAFDATEYVLNPTMTNKLSIREFYSGMISQVANTGNVYYYLKYNQELTVDSVEATRQGIIGVSTDEELSNMIRFQNAYNASSRFINVIDECIEHIINTLGS